jgi:hypothetical protein
MKYNQIVTTNLGENLVNKSKTTLFELEDDSVELKLPDDNVFESIQKSNKLRNINTQKLNGKWIVVNGNFIKPDQKNSNCDLSNYHVQC